MVPGKFVDLDARIGRADQLGEKIVDNSQGRPDCPVQRFGFLDCAEVQSERTRDAPPADSLYAVIDDHNRLTSNRF